MYSASYNCKLILDQSLEAGDSSAKIAARKVQAMRMYLFPCGAALPYGAAIAEVKSKQNNV